MTELQYHVVEETRANNTFGITSHTKEDAIKKSKLLKNPPNNPGKLQKALAAYKAKVRWVRIPEQALRALEKSLKEKAREPIKIGKGHVFEKLPHGSQFI